MVHKRNEDDGNSHGIRLPGTILDQIKNSEDKGTFNDGDSMSSRFDNGFKKRKGKDISRKDKRKQERALKKQKKSKHIHNSDTNVVKQQTKHVKKDNPLEMLKKLKEQKNKVQKKSADEGIKIIKEDDLIDDEVSDLDDEDNSGLENEFSEEEINDDDDDDNDDPIAKLMALKAAKNGTKASKSELNLKIVREDDLQDDSGSDDFDDFDEEEIEASDFDEASGDDEEEIEASDFDEASGDDEEEIEASDFDEASGDDEEEVSDPLAKLKALKEAKLRKSNEKPKKGSKKGPELTGQDKELLKRDEDDIAFYAKKLGLKGGKNAKLSKSNDDDDIGGLLDGLDFDFEKESEASDSENGMSGSEELQYSDADSDADSDESSAKQKENPFVAPVQTLSESKSGGKYIAPALRRKLALENNEVSEEVLNLRRAIKGPLNKLSESNIGTIVNEINGLFLQYPRHDVNENLTKVILDSIIQQGRLYDAFVSLHATLVVALYKLQGVDFGAYFIQTLVEKFDEYLKEGSKGKEASNLISLLSSAYNFQLVSSKLLYDIIRVLIENLNEENAELLLRIIRNSGNQMRTDDPTSLKEIVILINKANSKSVNKTNPRTQFLIESITSLKNNKLKVTNDASLQLGIRLKKFLGSISSSKFDDPIQVTYEDIHNIDTRGKWWLVGSAWKGYSQEKHEEPAVNEEAINDVLDTAEPNWMELARSQRMNTDIRRAVYISIMSASDYTDAMTKLDKLALKRAQEKEIPKVLIHCVGTEPTWNPYYGILASKLCDSHSYRKAFQFMFWDLIKELEGGNDEDEDFKGFDNDEDEDAKLRRILNVGRFYGYLLAEGSLPIHSLKSINFLTATKDTVLFMEVVFVTFFDNVGKKSQVFSAGSGLRESSKKMTEHKYDDKILMERIIKAKDQTTLLRGLRYFLSEKINKSSVINGKRQRKRTQWGSDAVCDIIDEILKSSESY